MKDDNKIAIVYERKNISLSKLNFLNGLSDIFGFVCDVFNLIRR